VENPSPERARLQTSSEQSTCQTMTERRAGHERSPSIRPNRRDDVGGMRQAGIGGRAVLDEGTIAVMPHCATERHRMPDMTRDEHGIEAAYVPAHRSHTSCSDGCTGLHQAGHPGVVAWRIFPTLLVCTSGRFSPGWTITTAQGAWRLTAVAVPPKRTSRKRRLLCAPSIGLVESNRRERRPPELF
jgi:hypothetical protein